MKKKHLQNITSSKLFIDKQLTKPDPNGLLSEQIFGPLTSYRCQCGNFNSKVLYEDEICPECNVKCINTESRYHTWAKIELLLPIVKKRKIDIILKILKKRYKYLLDPLQSDLTVSTYCYIKYNQYTDTISTENQYTHDCIPLAITGVYSLYLCLYTIKKYYQSSLAKSLLMCFMKELLVIPPNCRLSLVTEDKGNKKIYKSDLDVLYSDLINIQNYNKEHHSIYINHNQYYEMIKISLDNNLHNPIIDDQVKSLDGVASYFQFYCNKIYEKVSDILSGKSGLIRKDFLGKFLDFSSRSLVAVDPVLNAYEIRIPRKSFMKLWYLEYLRYLSEVKKFSLDKVKLLVKKSEVEDLTHLDNFEEYIQHFLTNTSIKSRLILMNRVPSLNSPKGL